jgi:hypothetical protein
MRAELEAVRPYTVLLLKKGPNYRPPDARSPEEARIVWEHGRRNMALRAEGIMPMVGPLGRGGETVGLCVFTVADAEIHALMRDDPAVQAGLFIYDLVDWYAFPGDGLPR